MCSKLTIKRPERRHEVILSYFTLSSIVSNVDVEQVNASWFIIITTLLLQIRQSEIFAAGENVEFFYFRS